MEFDKGAGPMSRRSNAGLLLALQAGRFRSNQPGTHPFAQRGLDCYPTPPIAVGSLLGVEPDLARATVYEPAAGEGNIVRELREHGITCVASDLIERGFPLNFTSDFLKRRWAPDGCTAVVSNPPCRLAEAFAAHALDLVPDVFLLLRLAFLESVRRTDLLERSGLRAVHVFRRRLPRMHRDGWAGPCTSSSICFAWFAWRRDWCGSAVLDRI
jgi:hypothetical protein